MYFKGAVFPKKHVGEFQTSATHEFMESDQAYQTAKAEIVPAKIVKAANKLLDNTLRTYMYYFTPAVLIGLFVWLRQDNQQNSSKFILKSALLINLAVLFWLFYTYKYISIRHSLPILLLIAIFTPLGIESIINYIYRNHSQQSKQLKKATVVFILIGITICSVRLFRPLHWDKKHYLQAADWIRLNTPEDAKISSFDDRITFYANRQHSDKGVYKVVKTKFNSNLNNSSQKTICDHKINYQIDILMEANTKK